MTQINKSNAKEINIREAVESDADALAALTVELGYPTDATTTRERLIDLIRAKDSILVAENESGVIGFILLHRTYFLHRPPDGRISTLVVSAPYRNQKIGAQLVQSAEQIFRELGCTRVEVTSGAPREAAHRFYRRAGYIEKPKRFIKLLTD